jgi:hypothetical protein
VGSSVILSIFAKETNALKKMKNEKSNQTIADYNAEIARLKKALRYERMRVEAYSTMIDVAEEMFHIQIRKKTDTE